MLRGCEQSSLFSRLPYQKILVKFVQSEAFSASGQKACKVCSSNPSHHSYSAALHQHSSKDYLSLQIQRSKPFVCLTAFHTHCFKVMRPALPNWVFFFAKSLWDYTHRPMNTCHSQSCHRIWKGQMKTMSQASYQGLISCQCCVGLCKNLNFGLYDISFCAFAAA